VVCEIYPSCWTLLKLDTFLLLRLTLLDIPIHPPETGATGNAHQIA
jgi:hypothetical protein